MSSSVSALAHTRKGLVCLAAITIAFLSGCATATRVALPPEQQSKITSSETFVSVTQSEIKTDINRSNITAATGGGLIFALIDAGVNTSRAKKAENRVTPLRDALVKYDLGKAFADALKTHFASVDWLKNSTVESRPLGAAGALAKQIQQSPADVVILADTDYRLSATFDSVTVTARVHLHPAKVAADAAVQKRGELPPFIYFNSLSTTLPVPEIYGMGLSPEEAAGKAAANGGENVVRALNEGLAELAHMLTYDLEAPAPADKALYRPPEGTDKRMLMLATRGAPLVTQGFVVHAEGRRSWLRANTGELCALP